MTQSELDLCFDKLWECWYNKSSENAARKALKVTILQGARFKDIETACRIYVLDNQDMDVEFTKKLSNFLLGDDWKDVLEGADLAKLEAQQRQAIELIEAWNNACREHWCRVVDIKERIPIAKRALTNKFFKENWKIALDKISKIFKYSFRDTDNRSKININFKWFCAINPNKFVVLDVMEGKFGSPTFEGIIPEPKKTKQVTPEERKEALKLFDEVFKKTTTQSTDKGEADEFDLI